MSRLDRVKSVLMQEISRIIQTKVSDPNVGFISITGIKLSSDLQHAWVYYSFFGKNQTQEKVLAGLKKSAKFIQFELGKVVKMRYVPQLQFEYDPSLERGAELIEKIKRLDP